eukprot:754647-Hanusia_phi.AAC.1
MQDEGAQQDASAEASRDDSSDSWKLPPTLDYKLHALLLCARDPDKTKFSLEAREVCLTTNIPVRVVRSLAEKASTLEDYKRVVEREWEVTCKREAIARCFILRNIAEHIPVRRKDSPLSGKMNEEAMRACGRMIVDALAAEAEAQPEANDKRREPNKMKFSVDEGNVVMLGTVKEFHGSLVDMFGLPRDLDDLYTAMEEEHCRRRDSNLAFMTPNDPATTTPQDEWEAVTDPTERERLSVPCGLRRIRPIEELMQDERVIQAGLRKEEVLALVLYTGPMYVKYIKILRAFRLGEMRAAAESNQYVTTIHCIVSGVIKLSKLEQLPSRRVVYRALKGSQTIESCMHEDELGWYSGVDYGIVSATGDLQLAIQNAGKWTPPTVLEIRCGPMGRGADLEFLSQYPEEQEMLYPPLSCLEVMLKPRLEEVDGQVVQFLPMKISANMVCSTIEETLGKRKQLYLAMMEGKQGGVERKHG